MPGDSGEKKTILLSMLSLYFISSAHHNNVGRDHKAWKCLNIYFLTTLLICRSDFLQPSYSNCILFYFSHSYIFSRENLKWIKQQLTKSIDLFLMFLEGNVKFSLWVYTMYIIHINDERSYMFFSYF